MVPIKKPKLLVIVGPTASGKSALAIRLAKKYNGEVISADSRQVYKGMDIGTGKVTKKEMSGIPHYMLDIVSPEKVYTVADYTKDATEAIKKVSEKNKLPIICGGTGFYIDSLVYGTKLPEVAVNKALRKKLEKLSPKKLYAILVKKDPSRAKDIHQNNKVRIIRALEIISVLGKVPAIKKTKNYDALIIGIKTEPKELKEKINKRISTRMKAGMVNEIKKLNKKGLGWNRMEALGLEYRYISRFVRGLISKEEMLTTLQKESWQYAKRQMTWFKANKEIPWYPLSKMASIEKVVKSFLD